MPNPTAAMIVIGDEILSGRTRDINMHHLAKELVLIGIDLSETRFIPDQADVIMQTINELRERYTHVFTSGGIGPTHDDITADCVARAFDVPIDIREDARQALAENYANPEKDLTPTRLRMARIPDGAKLIANPVSKAPGFSLENVHVMAGVPMIFEAMLQQLLPTLQTGKKLLSETINLLGKEGDIANALGQIAKDNPDTSIGSYPYYENDVFGCNVVVRTSDSARLKTVASAIKKQFL